MKIITTSLLLIITLLAVPLFSYFFGVTLGPVEWNALKMLMLIVAVVIAYTFIVGEFTGNNSQVDKLWSVIPIVYAWVAAAYGDYSPRLVLMSALVTLWGIRLTANFALKMADCLRDRATKYLLEEFGNFPCDSNAPVSQFS